MNISQKIKKTATLQQLYDPVIPLPVTYPKEMKSKGHWHHVLITVLFIIGKKR